MPRKATKTAAEPSKAPDQGVDTTQAAETSQEPPKKKIGRPSKYTPELAAEICQRLSNGEPLRQICRDDHMPAWQKIYEWMARDEELSGAIAQAREQGFEALAEEALMIADTPVFGQKQVMTDQGTATTVEDMLGHRKLQIETRLKLLAKWNPKKYGDRVQLAGDADSPLKVEADLTIFDTILKGLEQSRRG
jgi:hypothetical protein